MRLAFADSVLDLDTRRLQRGGRDVHLPPKTFQLLEILIRQRPRVVTKGELDELLWPKTYVARSSLSRLIAELRAALGDGARDAKIIRTVHAVGYAFCAPLAPGTASARKQAAITLQWGERTFPLDEGEYVLGRDEGCRVVIDAEGVSRRHARVTVCGNAEERCPVLPLEAIVESIPDLVPVKPDANQAAAREAFAAAHARPCGTPAT